MNIFAMDTSGPVAGCALMRDGKIVDVLSMNHGLTHSETIMPAVDRMLSRCKIALSEIDCFCAVVGPGSFTGVRIGVCAVKALAHGAGKPVCAVNALETLAMNAPGFDGLVCPILDARRFQVYCAGFRTENVFPERFLPDRAMPLDDLLDELSAEKRVFFVGDGVMVNEQRILKALPGRALIAPASALNIRPENACVLAARRSQTWIDGAKLMPYYLRAPQAERERIQRLKGK